MTEIYSSTLIGLLPDLLIVVLGVLVSGVVTSEVWKGLDRLVYYIFFPALLFTTAAARPLTPGDLAGIGAAAWLILLAGFCLGYGARRFMPGDWVNFAAAWQVCYRFNTVLAFVALQAFPEEAKPLLAVVVGLSVPLANILAVVSLSHGTAGGRRVIVRQLVSNPFVVASIAGLAVSMSGLSVPTAPQMILDRLADGALPLMLLVLGAALDWRSVHVLPVGPFVMHAVRLLVLPLFVWFTATGFGLVESAPLACAVALMFAGLPAGPASLTLASAYGAHRGAMARLITQSHLLALVSLPVWITIGRGWLT